MAEVARLSPRRLIGEITGRVMFFVYLGVVVGPLGISLLKDKMGGIAQSYVILSVCAVAAFALVAAARRVERAQALPQTD
jgi:sugar phosphate permease